MGPLAQVALGHPHPQLTLGCLCGGGRPQSHRLNMGLNNSAEQSGEEAAAVVGAPVKVLHLGAAQASRDELQTGKGWGFPNAAQIPQPWPLFPSAWQGTELLLGPSPSLPCLRATRPGVSRREPKFPCPQHGVWLSAVTHGHIPTPASPPSPPPQGLQQ